ncbi:MAG TPA: hypothetical protein PLA13_05455 [Microbacteriaceae bacterium]|nr:hypothetical protein [Microbacteriaceae bacterium]
MPAPERLHISRKPLDSARSDHRGELELEATQVGIDEAPLEGLLDGVAVKIASPRAPRPTSHGLPDRNRRAEEGRDGDD